MSFVFTHSFVVRFSRAFFPIRKKTLTGRTHAHTSRVHSSSLSLSLSLSLFSPRHAFSTCTPLLLLFLSFCMYIYVSLSLSLSLSRLPDETSFTHTHTHTRTRSLSLSLCIAVACAKTHRSSVFQLVLNGWLNGSKASTSRGEQGGEEGDAMSVFDNIKHRVHEKFKTAAELVIPVRSTSGMQENNYACACQMMMMMICLRACREWGGERGRESVGGGTCARPFK